MKPIHAKPPPGVAGDPTFGAYADFGGLRAAIVGSAEGLALPPFNPTLHHYNDEVQTALRKSGDRPLFVAGVMRSRQRRPEDRLARSCGSLGVMFR